ncbi:MAG: hypothetical protein JWO72_635 [Caulobacteraceae bacterium]|jgi:hypothetical protein|nr:hypothetical protein [Caulobacteraceae bacterium]
MIIKQLSVGLAVFAAAAALAACETSDAGGTTHSALFDNSACEPGPTPEGTRSGLACTTGSSTGTPSGSDVNVQGAATTGSAPQP